MSADKFATWLRQKMAEQLTSLPGESTATRVDRVLETRRALGLIRQRLDGHNETVPLWGAFIAAEHVPGLRRELGDELDAHLAQLDAELGALLVALCGAPAEGPATPAAAPSLWQRMKGAFGAGKPSGTSPSVESVGVDRARALALSRRLPGPVWLSLLSGPHALVRRVLLDAPPVDAQVRAGVEAQLGASRSDDEAAVALTAALGAIASPESEPVLRAVLWRAKKGPLRSAAITALVRVGPHTANEFSGGDVADRLAVVEGRRSDPKVVECLADASPEVVAAAADAVAALDINGVLRGLIGLITDGKPQAQQAALALVEPHLESRTHLLFSPLLRAATGAEGPVRVQADALVARLAVLRTLSRGQLTELRTALPKLTPGGPAAVAVAARLESGKGTVLRSEPVLDELEAEVELGADEKGWLVYADALSSTGDVRGELVILSSQGQPTRPYVEQHAAALLGEVPVLLDKDLGAFLDGLVWKHGFIETATLKLSYDRARDVTMERLLGAFLSAPAARFLSGLRVGLTSYDSEENSYDEVISTLAQWSHAHLLRRLVLGEFDYPDEMEISWAPWGDVSPLWTVAPALEELHLRGSGGPLGAINAPALRALIIETGGLARASFEAVVEMHAPRLERLELWFGDENYGAQCGTDDVERLLARDGLKLQSLGLKNAEFTHELVPLLARSKVLPGLKHLDLSLGALHDADAELLLRHAAAFAHLERLDLSGNQFDERTGELQQALPRAIFADQRHWADRGADEPGRYVAVGE